MAAKGWFEDSGVSKNGEWVQGYPSNWCWVGPRGGYWQNRDFCAVHWEVHPPQGAEAVRLHVESPRYEDDPELNGIKQELISALLSAELETAVHESGFGYELGRRLSDLSIQRYKCSEVFRVVVQDARSQGSHAANIRMVHNAVGGIVEGVLERFRNRVGDRLPQVTTLNR